MGSAIPDGGFQIGQGATYHIGSDRYPFSVVDIKSPCRVVVQQDNGKRTDKNGISENQTYVFEPNPDALRIVVSRRKDGRWRKQGDSGRGSGFFTFYGRDAYLDPSF